MPPLDPPILFAFWPTLASPWMLGWLAAAAAPLVIHLLSKRRFKEMDWAAMRYLLAAMKKTSRKIQVEQWILLAVRTLIILLLVFAVAQPFMEGVIGGQSPGARTHKLIVLDGSFSMAYQPGDQSLFQRAKELARTIVDDSRQGDGFSLLLMSQPPQVIVGTPAFEPNDFLEEIENLQLPHTGIDLPATLAKVEELLTRAREETPQLKFDQVFILSDLQRHGWVSDFGGEDARAEFLERSRRLADDRTRMVVIDLGQNKAENLALTELRSTEAHATVSEDIQFEVQLRNFGSQPRSRQRIEWLVDGKPAGEQEVDVEAGGEKTIGFSHQFTEGGDHGIEVRLAPDLLTVDNRRWLSLPIRQYLNVLCINGKPTGEAFTGATEFLRIALSPTENVRGRAVVRPDVMTENALLEIPNLNRYDCIFICNVRLFTAPEARRLESYLKSGGGLVFFLGDQVQAESYNRWLGGTDPRGVDLLPAKIGPVVTQDPAAEPLRIDPLEYRHPVVQVFRGNTASGLLDSPIQSYMKLQVPEGSNTKPVLAVAGGDPLIVERQVERGRSIVVATSADTSWTDLPKWHSYVPLIHELLAFAISGRNDEHNVEVGQTLESNLRTVAADVSTQVTLPSGEREPVRLSVDGASSLFSFSDTSTSGLYLVDFGPPVAHREVFAVNVAREESNLTKLTAAELEQEVWPDVPYEYFTHAPEAAAPRAIGSDRGEWHLGLLGAVLGLLFVESFLACRFGHHQR